MRLPVVEKKTWYDKDGLRFTCTQCGNCCTGGPGYVWITDEEVRRLAKHLNLSETECRRRHIRSVGGGQSFKEHKTPAGKYDCEFLVPLPGGRRGCGIYQARPLQCRSWPFWPENLESEKAWQATGRTCPGLNTGRHYDADEIAAIRDAEDWPEKPPTSRDAAPVPVAEIRKVRPRG